MSNYLYANNSMAGAVHSTDLFEVHKISVRREDSTTYQQEFEQYHQIRNAAAHLIANDSALSPRQIHEIFFAMTESKPVILLNTPTFAQDIDLFTREIIMNRLSKLMICDITMLDEKDTHNFFSGMSQPINYVLTKHETILIKARLRAYFRSLLAAQYS